ncbi:MAG: Fic family protein [Deltaproteobacteria bacterium]
MAWNIDELAERLLIGSTLVEGSTMSESEARQVLAGHTLQGHPIRELRELTNYRWATEWLLERSRESPFLSLDILLGYHARLMQGLADDAGQFKSHENYTIRSDGARFDYMPVARVVGSVAAWLADFNQKPADPVPSAAELYARFQAMHPFADGNGRIGRVLVAYYLHRESALGFEFYARDKLEHLRAVEASDTGDLAPLTAFIQARAKP